MIKGYTAEQIRAAEAPRIAAGEPLMARAATGLAREIRRLLPTAGGRVLLLIGSGDNGADALYAGAELATDGIAVTILTTGDRVHKEAFSAARLAGAHVATDDALTAAMVLDADVIVDGILGTGTSANPALRGRARDIVSAILPLVDKRPKPQIVAVDIPSGIDPTDGRVPDPTVLPADLTVTFGGYKAGLLIAPASEKAGRIVLVDIGMTEDLEKLEPAIITTETRDNSPRRDDSW